MKYCRHPRETQSQSGAVFRRRDCRGNTIRSVHHTAKRQQKPAKDKTALEIAANEALFGQTGGSADETWTLGLSSTSRGGSGGGGPWGSADANCGIHNPTHSGNSVGNREFKAKGGGDSLPLPGVDAPSMGNYERDGHFRMPMALRITGIGSGFSSPNGASMFAGVDSFLPDYDTSLYSLWNAPGGGSVMGYEAETDATQGQQQQVQPPLYMTSDDELKMDYPQLPEFNQDLDSYLNDTIESGASSTTALGTTTNNVMKMDHLVTTDRRAGAGVTTLSAREPQLERLLAPAAATATAEFLVKRDRGLTGLETTARMSKRPRGAYDDAYAAAPVSSGSMAGSTPSSSAASFRSLTKNPTIEPKRAVMPSLGSYHSGQSLLMLTPTSTSTTLMVSTGFDASTTPTTVVTSTSKTAAAVGSTKASKRPRSRQCEFPGCPNRARSHQKCKKHGGAHQCVFEGCTKNSQSRGLCIAHGGGSRCKREGCVRAAQSKGLCKSHGGGEYCAVEGCNKKAHLKHLCRTHGGGVRCKFEKCSKWAQRKGWCMAHAKEFAAT
ncbi:hypothetical protein PInf_025228 [Phytophthora infestans]|nr:hypothetical protein PInf_025228 [Phytophthora infestans]